MNGDPRAGLSAAAQGDVGADRGAEPRSEGGSSGGEEADYESEGSEDEGSEEYCKGGYHPVRVGDVYKEGRYCVERKLGWGHFSTVWLARDAAEGGRRVALKIQKSARHYTEAAMDEIALLRQVAEGDRGDTRGVVKLLDWFKHAGPHGQHVCMVFEYLGDNLLTLIKRYRYRGLPLAMVRQLSRHILAGLDYLHRECQVRPTRSTHPPGLSGKAHSPQTCHGKRASLAQSPAP